MGRRARSVRTKWKVEGEDTIQDLRGIPTRSFTRYSHFIFFFVSIAIDLLLFIYPRIRNKGRNIVDSNFNPRILHPLGTVIAGWFRAYTRMHALSNSMNVDNWLVSVSMGE